MISVFILQSSSLKPFVAFMCLSNQEENGDKTLESKPTTTSDPGCLSSMLNAPKAELRVGTALSKPVAPTASVRTFYLVFIVSYFTVDACGASSFVYLSSNNDFFLFEFYLLTV
jgi:hypothetical protein